MKDLVLMSHGWRRLECELRKEKSSYLACPTRYVTMKRLYLHCTYLQVEGAGCFFMQKHPGCKVIIFVNINHRTDRACINSLLLWIIADASSDAAMQKSSSWSERREMETTSKTDGSISDIEAWLTEDITKATTFMPSSRCSIYKAPRKLRAFNEHVYVPHIISIGPYHHGKESLGASEKYKILYLHSLIRHSPHTCLNDYVKSIREKEVEAWECYAEEVNLNSDEFVRMLILDGCFILELLIKYQEEESNMESEDCIFSATWMVPSIRRDLTLLENQIPFFVLNLIYDLSNLPSETPPLIQLVLNFFDPILPTILEKPKNYFFEAKHILDLLRNYLVHPFQPMDFGDSQFWEYTTCATALQEAGIKFRRKDTAECLLDITVTEDGKLEMPPFSFGESWKTLFPNLIALEQSRRDYPDMVTSYVVLVSKLINSQKDVQLLCDKRIIEGLFIKDEKVADVVDKLCQEVVVDKFYYDGLCNQVNAYCRISQKKWRTNLIRDSRSACVIM